MLARVCLRRYLKAAGGGTGKQVYTEGFSNFCKVGAGTCSGEWNVRLRTDIPGNGERPMGGGRRGGGVEGVLPHTTHAQ